MGRRAMKFSYPEGATPIDDISDLKMSWVKTLEDLNRVEAENISNASSMHLMKSINLPQQWFNIPMLRKIHRDMFSDVWDWAGKFRTTQTNPGIEPYQINGALADLCHDVQFWCHEACELTLLEQAAKIHHRLVYIHPYPNGNGRFSRLVSDRYLKAWKCPFPIWPIDMNKDGPCRKRYISALKEADMGCYEPLVLYMTEHGAKEPTLSELLGHVFFKQNFQGDRLYNLAKAHIRRGYSLNETVNNGHCLLNIALQHNLDTLAQLFIENDADTQKRDNSGLDAFEWALIRELYNIAFEIYQRGYPYTPRHPNQHLKVPHQNLYKFDMQFFS